MAVMKVVGRENQARGIGKTIGCMGNSRSPISNLNQLSVGA